MGASILRHAHDREFTVLPNATIRDPELSFRATGLLAYMVSLPNGAKVDSLSLSQRKKEGRDAVRTAFTELVRQGYARRYTEQEKLTGQWRTVIEISDVADPGTCSQSSGSRPSGSPGLGSRPSGPQALSKRKKPDERTRENVSSPKGDASVSGSDQDENFCAFWQSYPRRVAKGHARRAWRKAVKAKPGPDLVIHATRFANLVRDIDPQFIPHPSTWLNGERWEDQLATTEPLVSQPDRCADCDGHGWVLPDTGNEVVVCMTCRGSHVDQIGERLDDVG